MYDVSWAAPALEDLATIWVDADATMRAAITEAAERVDEMLVSPNEVGESRTEDRRIAFESPLGFTFQIQPVRRRVIVRHVWLTGFSKSS
jgi:hypothetical protein